MQPSDFEASLSGALTEEEIARRLNQPRPAPETSQGPDFTRLALRSAAVLVPLIWDQQQWHLLYTRRTEIVQSHKGQVSFPGGAADPEDLTPEDTALREAFEEIGLQRRDVTILGRLPFLATVTNYIITPVVGRIHWPVIFQPAAQEVSRIFTIPIDWLAIPENREVRPLQRVGYYEDVIYYQPYDAELLWGATARMTVEFLKTLGLIA